MARKSQVANLSNFAAAPIVSVRSPRRNRSRSPIFTLRIFTECKNVTSVPNVVSIIAVTVALIVESGYLVCPRKIDHSGKYCNNSTIIKSNNRTQGGTFLVS